MNIDKEKLKKVAKEKGIEMIVLFGSQADKTANEKSDYDVAVLTASEKDISKNLENYNDILFSLSEVLKIPDYKLDLTNLNRAEPFLRYEIFTNGKLLYGDELRYEQMKMTAMRRYIEMKDLRDLREKIIEKRQKILKEKIYD